MADHQPRPRRARTAGVVTAPRHLPAGTVMAVSVLRRADPYPADGDYVRRFWTGILGPTPTALLAALTGPGPGARYQLTATDLAAALGIDRGAPVCRKLAAALERLATFHLVDWTTDNRVYVASHVPRLHDGSLARLTPTLRAAHAAFEADRVGT